MAEITAVTFDLWQTLLLDRPEMGISRTELRLNAARQALLKVGEKYPAGVIEAAYREGLRRCDEIRRSTRDLSFPEQVAMFVNSISPGLARSIPETAFQEIAEAYSDCFFDYPAQPHPQAVNVLQSVSDLGLKLGLVSNTGMTPGAAFRRYLAQQGMLDFFAVLTFSDEVGVAKPSGEIFALTLERLGATPAQTVHVGDHPRNDVAGAGAFGLKTVWIEGFYPRPEPSEPGGNPDRSVPDLGQVPTAIRQLIGNRPGS